MGYTTPRWCIWGLCIADSVRGDECRAAVHSHNKVTEYLESNPDVAEEYRTDQSGAVKYYDVLRLAEAT